MKRFLLVCAVSFALPAFTQSRNTILLKTGQSCSLALKGDIVELRAVPGEYNNLSAGKMEIVPLPYYVIKTGRRDTLHFTARQAGTWYFASAAIVTGTLPDTLFSSLPPQLLPDLNAIQVVVRESDDYVGLLTELLNTPFILPPARLGKEGHQCDLRAGSDCAELAIYGMRRQGFDIPYCGPRGVTKYLDSLSGPPDRGTVIHFGGQVTVLYEDRGTKGVIDDDDLVIESYGTGAKIVSFRDCAYHGRKYQLYSWKKDLPRATGNQSKVSTE